MDQQKAGSAYREFRSCAYRHKYETALFFGGKSFTYGRLLERVEQAYNTFRQMGIEPRERVSLWLPNCPDLLCSFYALSRLGAVGAIAHPQAAPAEIKRQMREVGATRLITTAEAYEAYCAYDAPLGAGRISLCRPERDMKGRAYRLYRQRLQLEEKEQAECFLDEQMQKNRYHAGEPAFLDENEAAVLLFASSSFLRARPVLYLPAELSASCREFYRRKESVQTVYIEHSLAFEGGFLAVHGALCSAKAVLWGNEDPVGLLKRYRPDLIVGTEELFWELRQREAEFRGRWKNLQGGLLMGREISPLMEKYAPRAFENMGGCGMLCASPVPLKLRREALCFFRDFGIRLLDVETVVSRFDGVKKCRCFSEQGGFTLQVVPQEEGNKSLGAALIGRCRFELGALHLPKKVEFKAN